MLSLSVDIWRPVVSGGPSLTAQVQALFAAGRVGGMWDMGDIATLFQNSSTPVTAVAQPIGMVLDKSQGLVYGPQLVTNGDFSSGASWTLDSGWSISGGQLVGTTVAHANSATQSIPSLSANDFHEVMFTVNVASGALKVNLGNLGVSSTELYVSSSGTYTYLTPKSGTSQIVFWAVGSFTGTIDNVSIKALPGNHATQSTAGSRSLYQVVGGYGSAQFDGVDDYFNVSSAIAAGGTFNSFISAKQTGGIGVSHFAISANDFWAGAEAVHPLTPTGNNVGTPNYRVNGVTLSPSTRTQLWSQLSGVDAVTESTDLTLLAAQSLLLSGYMRGYNVVGPVQRALIISGTLTAGEKLLCRQWAAQGNGVTVV